SANLVIDQLVLRMSVGTNGGLTILFDEMHFVDGVPPVIDSVSTLPTVPMYYDYVQVNIYAHDDRTGIAEVYVDYYNGTGWNRLSTTDMVTFYAAVIPSLPYNTSVIYLVTAVDNGGLSFTDSRWFSYTVGDDVAPTLTINEPSDMADAEDSVVIVTSPDDDGGSGIDYVEFRADTTLYSTDHTFPYSVIMDVDSLSLGTHMINVTAYDIAGNAISDDVTINVVDTTTPTIDSPGDISYSESTSGHWIAWTPDDARPDSYEVFLDGVSTYSNTWNSTSETIDILLDGLSLGEYNYTCVVYDDLGLWIADTVLVTVIDGTVPTLDSPPDVEFTEGTSGHLLTWHPDDLHPVSYSIEVDEVELLSGQWNSSSEIITFSLDALTVGSHNVTLIVTDIGGNSISDGVSVTVLAVVVPTTTTTPPTTTTTTITTTPTTPPPSPDIITIAIIGGVGLIIVVVIAIVFMKKSSK
ncbi:MAG: hypothetical protein JW779_06515, partial [Candidatus Thorarchaeota archaeon]|nr:hypothetical protein [Candidatus Thorarchaeota archaeon]